MFIRKKGFASYGTELNQQKVRKLPMNAISHDPQVRSALQILRAIAKEDATVQSRLASGLRVGSAMDNAAYWSIATTMRSDQKAMLAVQDSLNTALSVVETARQTEHIVMSNLYELKNDLIQGYANIDNDAVKRKIEADMQHRISSISSAVRSASFGGLNIINREVGQPTTFSYVSAAVRDNSGNFSLRTVDVDLTDITMIDVTITRGALSRYYLDAKGTTAGRRLFKDVPLPWWQPTLYVPESASGNAYNSRFLEAMIDIMDQITSAAIKSFASLGALSTSIQSQIKDTNAFVDAHTKGIGKLVDANIEEESAKHKALQVREQIALQSLQIANSESTTISMLFSDHQR